MRKLWLSVLAILILCVGSFAGVLAILPKASLATERIANTETPLPIRTATIANTLPTPLPTPTRVLAIVLAAGLHIRSGPGMSYMVTGWLRAGDRVQILGCRAGWAKIETGWINATFIDKHCGDNNAKTTQAKR